MSGGKFNYSQCHITNIAEQIEHELEKQGKEKSKEELWGTKDYYKEYPEEMYHPIYPEKVQEELENAVYILKKAAIYAQRVDWYLSGDDGDESFLKRLKTELEMLEISTTKTKKYT